MRCRSWLALPSNGLLLLHASSGCPLRSTASCAGALAPIKEPKRHGQQHLQSGAYTLRYHSTFPHLPTAQRERCNCCTKGEGNTVPGSFFRRRGLAIQHTQRNRAGVCVLQDPLPLSASGQLDSDGKVVFALVWHMLLELWKAWKRTAMYWANGVPAPCTISTRTCAYPGWHDSSHRQRNLQASGQSPPRRSHPLCCAACMVPGAFIFYPTVLIQSQLHRPPQSVSCHSGNMVCK